MEETFEARLARFEATFGKLEDVSRSLERLRSYVGDLALELKRQDTAIQTLQRALSHLHGDVHHGESLDTY